MVIELALHSSHLLCSIKISQCLHDWKCSCSTGTKSHQKDNINAIYVEKRGRKPKKNDTADCIQRKKTSSSKLLYQVHTTYFNNSASKVDRQTQSSGLNEQEIRLFPVGQCLEDPSWLSLPPALGQRGCYSKMKRCGHNHQPFSQRSWVVSSLQCKFRLP